MRHRLTGLAVCFAALTGLAPTAVGDESEEPESTEQFSNPLEGVLEETVEGYLSEHRLVGCPNASPKPSASNPPSWASALG